MNFEQQMRRWERWIRIGNAFDWLDERLTPNWLGSPLFKAAVWAYGKAQAVYR